MLSRTAQISRLHGTCSYPLAWVCVGGGGSSNGLDLLLWEYQSQILSDGVTVVYVATWLYRAANRVTLHHMPA